MSRISIFFQDAKPFSKLLGLFFLFLTGFILATGLNNICPPSFVTPTAIRWSMLMQAISQLMMFLLPAVLFAMLFYDSTSPFLKLHFRVEHWRLSLVAVVILLLLVPLNDWITWWNDQWDLGGLEAEMRKMTQLSKDVVGKMLSLTNPSDLMLQILVVAFIPAVCEELFFRGALQQLLQEWFRNVHVAVIVTSLIFSLFHGDIYGLVPRFLLGVLLGYLFLQSGSLLVNVCAHFFNNALIVVLYYLYNKGVLSASPEIPLQMSWFTTLICAFSATALFVLYFVKKNTKKTSE
ncbi:MAG: CPBP family intramembrane metalloprotease [Bacteroidales bacterium]|nr:CPBP family intramembrane metalloprotease [Bacteroidales bacterium]